MRDIRAGMRLWGPPGVGVAEVQGFAMVVRMPDDSIDPSGNTEAFRAFTQNAPDVPAAASRTPLIAGVVVVAVVLIALVAWLALS
jgi:hypothetical protein